MEFFHQNGDVVADRYQILRLLGQGGSGITYVAQDLQSQQQVVLKALSLRHLNDWKQMELFEREARILESLNHPAIPQYLDYFQVDTADNRAFYIAQEFAVGESLSELVEKGWRTNEQEVRQIAAQVLEILIYLHSLTPPVIHRDIKPQNLIRSKAGKIFLVDFGAVQDTYRGTLVRGSTVVGTYGYMAPEQFRGQAVVGTDFYALGATLLFLLTHRPPSDLPQERLKISFRNRVQISDSFATWLEKLLEPDADNRFRSAKEALTALRQKVLVSKPTKPLPLAGLIGGGIAGAIALILLVIFRYPAMKLVGIAPANICAASMEDIKGYLAQGGDPKEVRNCLWPYESYRTENPMNDLFEVAVLTKNFDLVMFLLNQGINLKWDHGSPLTSVVSVQNLELVKLLLEKGANVNVSPGSYPPLSAAARDGNLELAKLLLDKGASVNVSPEVYSPLARAVNAQNLALVKLLLDKGANVNVKNPEGETPLTAAVNAQNLALVKLLLNKGADPNVFYQSNPFSRTEDSAPPLVVAIRTKNLALAKLLLNKGADPNVFPKVNQFSITQDSYPPLMQAIESENLALVKLLLEKGANVNMKTLEGETPLRLALTLKQSAIASLLKKHGARR